jgi:hypothetical protein
LLQCRRGRGQQALVHPLRRWPTAHRGRVAERPGRACGRLAVATPAAGRTRLDPRRGCRPDSSAERRRGRDSERTGRAPGADRGCARAGTGRAVVTAAVMGLLVALGTRGTLAPDPSSGGCSACSANGCGSEAPGTGPRGFGACGTRAAACHAPPARGHAGCVRGSAERHQALAARRAGGGWGSDCAGPATNAVHLRQRSSDDAADGSGQHSALHLRGHSHPVAAGMLLAGVSPGTVLVSLLAGPITRAATLAQLRREFSHVGLAWR